MQSTAAGLAERLQDGRYVVDGPRRRRLDGVAEQASSTTTRGPRIVQEDERGPRACQLV
ncbi:MAG: hypothetical protein ACYC1E_13495 [Propionibacteriaceae bacterium]